MENYISMCVPLPERANRIRVVGASANEVASTL